MRLRLAPAAYLAVRASRPRRRRTRSLAAVAALLTLAVLALPASASAATCPQTSVADIEDEVMCPVCKTPLGLAQEAPQADRERVFILERVERCESKETIKAALAAEFGDEVLATPESEGFDLAAYLVPGLALALGLGACAFAVNRWIRARPPSALATAAAEEDRGSLDGGGSARAERPAPSSAATARLERDLERYDL
jgi:cytochrome c-type biogenesis protein CcmH/NrfF